MTHITDPMPRDAAPTREIGFSISENYNASAILFDNLTAGRGDRPAILSPSGTWTYAQLCAAACRFANGFTSLGLTRGDRVLLFLDDTPFYPAAIFGAIRAGFVPLLINTLTPPDLLQFYLEDSAARVAVADAAFASRFDAVACTATQLENLIVLNGDAPGEIPVKTLSGESWLENFSTDAPCANTTRDDMAFWLYSSGSTGRPKGIVHLQHDMAYTHASYGEKILGLTAQDICFSVPKIFFAYGFGNSVTFPFSVGAAAVLMPGQPKPEMIFDSIRTFRPTVFFGLPTLYTALTKSTAMGSADTSSLRLAVSAAEILSADVFGAWKAHTGLSIVEGLGSSEVLHVYLSNTLAKQKPGAAGQRVPGYEIALRDVTGRDVADNEEGILWVRGDSNAPCYWNRPDKTAESMRDGGWIYTGDRFVRDEEGFHFFRGRADDLVKVSGQWVYPLEVELCLAEHPLVRECAVMAIEMEDRRTTIKAVVALNAPAADYDAVTRILQDYVKASLLPYKYPRLITFVGELPKTGTGKVDRQALLRD